MLIERAPRSQFDALQEAQRRGSALTGACACVALTGDGFHGQRGRAWATAEGNLHLTATVPINAPFERVVPALTMLPAVAVVSAIRRCVGERVRPAIKWVNDILIDRRKVAGVLTATSSQARVVERAVFGIGVNVARTPAVAPTPFVPHTTSLHAECGDATPALGDLLDALLTELAADLTLLLDAGPAALTAQYLECSMVVGQRVAVYHEDSDSAALGTPLAEGVVDRINPDLTLVLEDQTELVHRGRLALQGA